MNLRHPKRFYADQDKQKMIDEKRVPVKRAQLNVLLKKVAPQIFWDSRERKEIMPLVELRSQYDTHAQQQGHG